MERFHGESELPAMPARTKIEKISIADTIPLWQQHLQSQHGDTDTVRHRLVYLRRFERVCSTGRKPLMVCDIHAGHLADVFNSYGDRQFASKNNLLVALRAYLRWCVRRHFIDRDDADDAISDRKRVAYQPAPKYRMPEHLLPKALEVAGNSHPQRRAVVAMTLSTLARESELSPLRLSDLDLEERTVQLYRRKTKRYSTDRFDPYWFGELTAWLEWYAADQGYASPQEMINAHPDWYLIPRMTAHGGNCANAYKKIHPDLQYKRMEYVVKYVLDELGIETPCGNGDSVKNLREGMHMFRRSGARAMFKHLSNGHGRHQALLMVKAKLDHKSLEQTITYIGADDDRDELNEYLLEDTMYGFAAPAVVPPPPGVTVLPVGEARERRRAV
jgi:integrase